MHWMPLNGKDSSSRRVRRKTRIRKVAGVDRSRRRNEKAKIGLQVLHHELLSRLDGAEVGRQGPHLKNLLHLTLCSRILTTHSQALGLHHLLDTTVHLLFVLLDLLPDQVPGRLL